MDAGQAGGAAPPPSWRRGLRLTLRVDNLLDTRPRVRNRLGATPAGLEPDRLEPEGRRLVLAVRKIFLPASALLRPPPA